MKKNPMQLLPALCFVLFGLSFSLASSTVTPVGPSSLNGVPMMVYAMTYAKDNLKSTGKLWIGTANNLPYHAERDVELPGTPAGGKAHPPSPC